MIIRSTDLNDSSALRQRVRFEDYSHYVLFNLTRGSDEPVQGTSDTQTIRQDHSYQTCVYPTPPDELGQSQRRCGENNERAYKFQSNCQPPINVNSGHVALLVIVQPFLEVGRKWFLVSESTNS